MVRYIELEAAIKEFERYGAEDDVIAVFNSIPVADVVKVVRCGQCKYCVEHYDTDGNIPYWTCKEWDSGTDYDGYCHYGERKDGGQNK